MGIGFWARRFATVFSGAFAILLAVRLLRGWSLVEAAAFVAGWALVATSIFVAARIYRTRQGQVCELCNDLQPQLEQRDQATEREGASGSRSAP